MPTPAFLKNRKFWTITAAVIGILLVAGGYVYSRVFTTRIQLSSPVEYLYLKNTDTYADVLGQLYQHDIITDKRLFEIIAEQGNYPAQVKPGKYKLTQGQTYIDLVRLLRSGRQEEVKLVINGMISKEQLVGIVTANLAVDSIVLINMLEDTAYLANMGFTKETALCLFVPNTYNFYWNTSAPGFMERMKKEYDKFWNDERKRKAKAVNLTPVEVGILASIVDGETNKVDEMSVVAKLYLNRLAIDMALQADPTVKFALRNSGKQRVYTADTRFDSPYNTYIYTGLPPGPIAVPSQQAITAVLNPSQHNFLYMCAKEDFSGYHNFTASFDQHCLNARRYQLELNKRGIK